MIDGLVDGGWLATHLADVRVVDAAGVTRLRDATVELRAGTVVGVAAVEGSGQHELPAQATRSSHPASTASNNVSRMTVRSVIFCSTSASLAAARARNPASGRRP